MKPRKIENQSLRVMVATTTKVETIWEEAVVVHPWHASIAERQVTSQWIALSLKRSEEVAVIEVQWLASTAVKKVTNRWTVQNHEKKEVEATEAQ